MMGHVCLGPDVGRGWPGRHGRRWTRGDGDGTAFLRAKIATGRYYMGPPIAGDRDAPGPDPDRGPNRVMALDAANFLGSVGRNPILPPAETFMPKRLSPDPPLSRRHDRGRLSPAAQSLPMTRAWTKAEFLSFLFEHWGSVINERELHRPGCGLSNSELEARKNGHRPGITAMTLHLHWLRRIRPFLQGRAGPLTLAGLGPGSRFMSIFFAGEARGEAVPPRYVNAMGELPGAGYRDRKADPSSRVWIPALDHRPDRAFGAGAERDRYEVCCAGCSGTSQDVCPRAGMIRFLLKLPAPAEKRPEGAMPFLEGPAWPAALGFLDAHLAGRDWIRRRRRDPCRPSCCSYLFLPRGPSAFRPRGACEYRPLAGHYRGPARAGNTPTT